MWKRTSLGEVAENSFTGTFTSPKLIDPLQIGRGMKAPFLWKIGRMLFGSDFPVVIGGARSRAAALFAAAQQA